MESQKESLLALSAEVKENATPLAKTINDFYDQITSIAKDRNIPVKDIMAVLAVPLQPRLQAKRERGPTAFNLFTAERAHGNGDLAAAAAQWKVLSEERKKSYDPSIKEHNSPKKKRRYKPSVEQMKEIMQTFRSLVSNALLYRRFTLLTYTRLMSTKRLEANCF
jgi:hypothetical protein